MPDRLAPAVLAEDLRALADCVPFDARTVDVLDQAAAALDTVASPIPATARLGAEQRAVSEPSAAAPWTVTLAWTPDQNFGAVSALNGRVALQSIFGLLHAGEAHESVAVEFGLSGQEVAVLDRLRQEMGDGAQGPDPDPDADEVLLVRLPGRMSGRVTVGHSRLPAATVMRLLSDAAPVTVMATYPSLTVSDVAVLTQLARDLADVRVPVDLDTLIGWVESALESSAIEVDVWETGLDGARTALSTNPLYRLVRCLRSAGLLNEHDDGPQVR